MPWRDQQRSGVCFQGSPWLPATSVLLSRTVLHSQFMLKQMTAGFPRVDHNTKNTPTAYCSHLPLQHHPPSLLSFPTLLFACCVFSSSSQTLSSLGLLFLSRLPSRRDCTVTGAWMCFSAFSTTESSLCQRVKGRLSGWAHSEGAEWKTGGGGSWEGGVTGLPGCDLIIFNLLFPRQPLRSPLADAPLLPSLSYSS